MCSGNAWIVRATPHGVVAIDGRGWQYPSPIHTDAVPHTVRNKCREESVRLFFRSLERYELEESKFISPAPCGEGSTND